MLARRSRWHYHWQVPDFSIENLHALSMGATCGSDNPHGNGIADKGSVGELEQVRRAVMLAVSTDVY
jgi:hypothetical protein